MIEPWLSVNYTEAELILPVVGVTYEMYDAFWITGALRGDISLQLGAGVVLGNIDDGAVRLGINSVLGLTSTSSDKGAGLGANVQYQFGL